MKKMLIILVIFLLLGSCTTVQWDNMSQNDKRATIIYTAVGVLYAGGMTYWVMNPMETQVDWPQ